MGEEPDSAQARPGGARAALRGEYHLACVDGPDAGILVPIPAVLGRSDELFLLDPALSREHASIMSKPGRRPRIEVRDLDSTNGSAIIRRGSARPLRPGRPHRLRRGERLKCGADLFELRRRPAKLLDQAQPRRGRRWLALLPLLSLVLLGARFLTLGGASRGFALPAGALLALVLLGLVLLGLALIRGRRRLSAARADECGTALHLARMAAARSGPSTDGIHGRIGDRPLPFASRGGGGDEAIRIPLPRKRGLRGVSRLWPAPSLDCGSPASPSSIGVIGAKAEADAARIAASLLRRVGGGCLVLPDGARKAFGREEILIRLIDAGSDAPGSGGPRDPDAPEGPRTPGEEAQGRPQWRIVAAPSIRELPEWCEQILPASAGALSPLWWEQFDAADPASLLPASLSLADLLSAADPPLPFESLAAPLGRDSRGTVILDLVAEGPHALVAGTTGSGKSEALLTWIRGICALHSPDEVRFILFDYKGGSAFGPLAGLAHVDRVLTDLDASLSARALSALSALLSRRERELAELGLPDYAAWARAYGEGRVEGIAPRIVIVIDEFRALVDSHEGGLRALMRLAAQGRSLGLHLIAATQRPAGAVNADMRANLELRIALRCLSPADSIDVLSSTAAAELERAPGRAIIADRGMIQFAMSSASEPVLGARERPEPLPWAPYPPEPPGPRELRAAERRAERTTGVSAGRDPVPGVVGLGLVDGIDEGEHRLLAWNGGWIALAAPMSEEGLAREEAIALGARIADARGLPLHVCASALLDAGRSAPPPPGFGAPAGANIDPRRRRDFGASTWIWAEDGEDAALLLHEARTPGVLVIADLERSRRAMDAAFGPLAAERLWSEGLDSLAAAGGVLVCAAAGARVNDPVAARCSMRFERPDPQAPQMRGTPPPQSVGAERWVWTDEGARRLIALVRPEEVKVLRASSARGLRGSVQGAGRSQGSSADGLRRPLVRTWEEAEHRPLEESEALTQSGRCGQSGLRRSSGLPGSAHPPANGPRILIGPNWLPLEEAGDGRDHLLDAEWLIEGDEGNLEKALIEKARILRAGPPRITSRATGSWTAPDPPEEVSWVIIAPTPERLRSLTRGPNPLPAQYSGRISQPNAGVARLRGRWTRIRFLP